MQPQSFSKTFTTDIILIRLFNEVLPPDLDADRTPNLEYYTAIGSNYTVKVTAVQFSASVVCAEFPICNEALGTILLALAICLMEVLTGPWCRLSLHIRPPFGWV